MTASAFNELVRKAARNVPLPGIKSRRGLPGLRYKWAVTVQRAGKEARDWIVNVGDGCVNDRPAVIETTPLWSIPRPFLELKAPSTDPQETGDFQKVADTQRPQAFRTREMWQFDLYRASVIVRGIKPFAADPLLEIPILPPTFTLVGVLTDVAFRQVLASIGLQERLGIQRLRPPYKVHVGRFPLILDGSESFRLAWLYLLRQPGAPPTRDSIVVQQLCFWNLAAYSVLEDEGLLSLLPVLQAMGDIGNLTALSIFEILVDSARIRWWTH